MIAREGTYTFYCVSLDSFWWGSDRDCKSVEEEEDTLRWARQAGLVRGHGTWAGPWRTWRCRESLSREHLVRSRAWTKVNRSEDVGGAEKSKSTLVRGATDPTAGGGRKRLNRLVRTSGRRILNFLSPRTWYTYLHLYIVCYVNMLPHSHMSFVFCEIRQAVSLFASAFSFKGTSSMQVIHFYYWRFFSDPA